MQSRGRKKERILLYSPRFSLSLHQKSRNYTMEYIVSARKYRPMSFDSVVGQSALTTTLKNAVKSGKLAHAYLFCGPRGVGKTTCARIFAKAINCMTPTDEGEACNHCESCDAFNEQRSYNIFELDAASNNSVENIKALMDQTRIPPQVGRYKVFIIDEVHMLSTQAFNAFLKTLEEPPAHVIFILATTEKHKILPTILSRCQAQHLRSDCQLLSRQHHLCQSHRRPECARCRKLFQHHRPQPAKQGERCDGTIK